MYELYICYVVPETGFQNLSDEEYHPDVGNSVPGDSGEPGDDVKGERKVEGESGSASSDNGEKEEEEGSEIETPSSDGEMEVGGVSTTTPVPVPARKGRDTSSKLIGPSKSTVPSHYHGNNGYQSYVRSVLERMRGEKGVLFPNWMPQTSDWQPISEW